MIAAELRTLLTADTSSLEKGLQEGDQLIRNFIGKKYPGVKLTVDVEYTSNGTRTTLPAIQKAIDGLKSKEVTVKVNAEGSISEVTSLGKVMDKVTSKTVEVKVNASGAIAEVTELGRAMDSLNLKQEALARSGGAIGRGGFFSASADQLQRRGFEHLAIGAILTTTLTAPLVKAGSDIIGFASNFQKAMTEAINLSDLGRQNFDSLSKQILALSDDKLISAGPKKLAEGLYFVASRGLDASDSMTALRASAYGSSAGLGSVATVGKTVTDVIAAYGLKASESMKITDALTAAVRRGGAEADSYAKLLGRVIPTAAKLGIPYQDVFANVAEATKSGLSPEEAVTGYRQLLANLADPTQKAAKALADMKLSGAQLRAIFNDSGFLGAVKLLNERSGGNFEKISAVIGNIRGLTNYLSTAGGNTLPDYQDTQKAVYNSAGDTMRAAAGNSSALAFQMEKLNSAVEKTGIQIGTSLLPPLTDFVKLAGRDVPAAFKAWSDLPGSIKAVSIGLVGLAGLSGPLLSMFGLFEIGISGAKKLRTALAAIPALAGVFGEGGALGAGLLASPVTWAVIAVAIVGAIGLAYKFNQSINEAADLQEKLAQNAERANAALNRALNETPDNKAKAAIKELQKELQDAGDDVNKVHDLLQKTLDAKHEIKSIGLAPNALAPALAALDDFFATAQNRFNHLGGYVDPFTPDQTKYGLGWLTPAEEALAKKAKLLGREFPAKPQDPNVIAWMNGLQGQVTPEAKTQYAQELKDYNAQVKELKSAVNALDAEDKKLADNNYSASFLKALDDGLTKYKNNLKGLQGLQTQFNKRYPDAEKAPKNEAEAIGAINERVTALQNKAAADAERHRKAQAELDQKARKDAEAQAELDANRMRQIEIKQLTERAQMWERFASLTEKQLGGVRQLEETAGTLGDKTAKSRIEAELLKRTYQGIDDPLKRAEIALAGIVDQMQRAVSLRDGFRSIFNEAFKGLEGADQQRFAGMVAGFSRGLRLDSFFGSLQRQRDASALLLIGTSENELSGIASRREQLSTAGARLGAKNFAADAYLNGGNGAGGTSLPSGVSLDALRRAIIGKESSGSYRIVNPDSGAIGYGQVMPYNVAPWTQAALGHSLSAREFRNNPQAQIETINHRMGMYLQEELKHSGGDLDLAIRRVASRWYSGKANLYQSTKSQGKYPTISAYSKDVLGRYYEEAGKNGVGGLAPFDVSEASLVPAGTKVSARINATPAKTVRPVKDIELPPSPIFDNEMLTARALPKAWGTPMSQYHARPGELTTTRASIEAEIEKRLEELDSLERGVALQRLAILEKRKKGVAVTKAELDKLAQSQKDARDTRTEYAAVTDPKNLARLRAIGAFADTSASRRAADMEAPGAIAELERQMHLTGSNGNPYLALLDSFTNGKERFYSDANKSELSNLTIGGMIANARANTRAQRYQLSRQYGAIQDVNPLLSGGNFSQSAFDRGAWAATKRREVFDSADIQGLYKTAEALRKQGDVLGQLAVKREAVRQATNLFNAAEKVYLAQAQQGAQLAYAQQMEAQRQNIGDLDREISLTRRNPRLSRQQIADDLEVERLRRDALKALQDSAPYFSPEQQAENERKASEAATGKRTEINRRNALSHLAEQREYNTATATRRKTLAAQINIAGNMAPDDPDTQLQMKLAEKRFELAGDKTLRPWQRSQRLQDYKEELEHEQRLETIGKSKANVLQMQGGALDEQQRRAEAFARTETQRLKIQLEFEAQKRSLSEQRETAEEAAARKALDNERLLSAAQADRMEKARKQADDVRGSIRDILGGNTGSLFTHLREQALDYAAGSITNSIYGKDTVDNAPGGLLSILLGGIHKSPKAAKEGTDTTPDYSGHVGSIKLGAHAMTPLLQGHLLGPLLHAATGYTPKSSDAGSLNATTVIINTGSADVHSSSTTVSGGLGSLGLPGGSRASGGGAGTRPSEVQMLGEIASALGIG